MVRASLTATLGDALNAGTGEAASGELITKMDDDDHHGPEHPGPGAAAEYSGAELVAKGAEFIYLEQLDLTIRRFAGQGRELEPHHRWRDPDHLEAQPPGPRRMAAAGHGVDVWLLVDRRRGRAFRTHFG